MITITVRRFYDKCELERQKYRRKLMPNTKFQPYRRFVRNDLVEKKIKSCRKVSKKFLEFKEKLGLDPNEITSDEQDIVSALQVAFERETILTQYYVEKKRLDPYLPKFKLGIEVDEYDLKNKVDN